MSATDDMNSEIERLKDENDELRHLVAEIWHEIDDLDYRRALGYVKAMNRLGIWVM